MKKLCTLSQDESIRVTSRSTQPFVDPFVSSGGEQTTTITTSSTIGVQVAIGIVSLVNNIARRNAIRNTWLSKDLLNDRLSETVEYAFFIGLTNDDDIPLEIIEEMNTNHDIIIVNIEDTYSNMIFKIEAIFNWGIKNCGVRLCLQK